ncbi:hypothetical protein AMTR_s05019p00005350 [Amborella trichopoda]|uniref:Uncharacterized protein n=1 Tax=Amborella trichopoda TaxID=13333 RepID=U5CV32_AMBTC|nr:hypothetical protein AMTR_s05019p00005350 [Amborella trichopoda]
METRSDTSTSASTAERLNEGQIDRDPCRASSHPPKKLQQYRLILVSAATIGRRNIVPYSMAAQNGRLL